MSYILEIHHIGISSGDATVIAVKQKNENDKNYTVKCKVLIDAGGESPMGDTQIIIAYCNKFFGDANFDYVVASHYHADHISGFFYVEGIEFEKFVDIGIYDAFKPINHKGQKLDNKTKYYADKMNGKERVEIPFIKNDKKHDDNKPLKLRLVNEEDAITLTCYCANGILANGTNVLGDKLNTSNSANGILANGTNVLKGKINTSNSANDHSLAWILKYNDFRYFTAGDLSGEDTARYVNVEGPLVKYLSEDILKENKIDVLKATHHGSAHNTYGNMKEENKMEVEGENSFVLDTLQPETIIVPCNQHKSLPASLFLSRVMNYYNKNNNRLQKIFFVNECEYPGRLKTNERAAKKSDFEKDIFKKISNIALLKNGWQLSNGVPTAIIVRSHGKVNDNDEKVKDPESAEQLFQNEKYEMFERKFKLGLKELEKRISKTIKLYPISKRYIDPQEKGQEPEITRVQEIMTNYFNEFAEKIKSTSDLKKDFWDSYPILSENQSEEDMAWQLLIAFNLIYKTNNHGTAPMDKIPLNRLSEVLTLSELITPFYDELSNYEKSGNTYEKGKLREAIMENIEEIKCRAVNKQLKKTTSRKRKRTDDSCFKPNKRQNKSKDYEIAIQTFF